MKQAVLILLTILSLNLSAAFARPSLSDLPPGLYGYESPTTGQHSVYYVANPADPSEDPFSLQERPLPSKFIPLVEQVPQNAPNRQPAQPQPSVPNQSKWYTARKKFGRFLQGVGAGLSPPPSYATSSDDDPPTISRFPSAPLSLMTPAATGFSGPTTITQFGNTTTISTPGQLPTTATQFGNTTTINRPFQMPSTINRFGNTWTMSDPNGGLPTTMTKFGNTYTVSPPFGMPSTITPFGNSMMINTPGQMPTTFTKFGNSWMSNP